MVVQDLFIAANTTLSDIVRQIQENKWHLPLPPHARYVEDQTLRDLVNVCAYENKCVPAMLDGVDNLGSNVDLKDNVLGDDWLASYMGLEETANQAVRGQQNLESIVHMSYGDEPASRYLNDISIQRTAAAYDIASIIGAEAHLPSEAITELIPRVEQFATYLRETGIFPPEITVDDTASPGTKLMALMGRRPYNI